MQKNDTFNVLTSDRARLNNRATAKIGRCSLTIESKTADHKPDSDQGLMNVRELAAHLNVSVSAVYRLVERRDLPFFRIPRGLRFYWADVESYLNNRRVEAVK